MRNLAGRLIREIDGEKTMGLENIDITNRGVVERRETVAIYEAKLAAAEKQREALLLDMRKASARVDKGDRRARLEVATLGKQDAAVGRLVRSIESQLAEAKKWLGMAVNQAATAAARQASVAAGVVLRDKLFEVACPDGRKVRHRHHSLEALRKELQPGYVAIGQVFGANEDGTGGIISRPGEPSMLKALLESQGDELLAFLAEHGIVGSEKTVIILPSNDREAMQ
jgi:hypothetical protein